MVRVLVGMVMPADSALMLSALQDAVQPPPYGSDINDMGKALAAKEQLVKHLRTQLMRGLPSEAEQKTLQQLKAQLESGAVEMKVFTTAPLHGKTYIFHAPGNAFAERRAYVGSSNLTNAGFYKNLELNIDVTDNDASGKLADWFTDRWDDPFSLKITAEIIELIEESWASENQPTPYEVYLKVCHALSEDAREGMGYVLPPSIENLLLDYQETAVRTLARRIVRRGGTMLGDVVGLGKTLTAIATALMLEAAEDYTTLVLCPKNLERMWEEHLESYGLAGRAGHPVLDGRQDAARAQALPPRHLRRVAQPAQQLHQGLRGDPGLRPPQRLEGPAADRDSVQPRVRRRRQPDRPLHRRRRRPRHPADGGDGRRTRRSSTRSTARSPPSPLSAAPRSPRTGSA